MTAAREWYAAADLAGKPGMPGDKRSVRRLASTMGWRSREVAGQGGATREFHISALPAATRAALVWHRVNVLAGGHAVGADQVDAQALATATQLGMAQGQRETLMTSLADRANEMVLQEGLRQAAALSDKEQARMDARLVVLKAVEAFRQASGLSMTVAEQQFAAAWRAGPVGVTDQVRQIIGPKLSFDTLQRWRLALKTGGISRLAGEYGNRRGASIVGATPVLRAFVEAMLVAYPHARATQVMAGLRARLASQVAGGELELPSIRSLERWILEWRAQHKQTLLALENPDAYKNKYMAAFGSQSEGVDSINARWELDSSPADVMLTDGRHSLIGGIDVFTRRAWLLVSRTSKATAVCGVLRAMLLAWGVPSEVKTDNGSDYTSNHVVRVLAGLEVTHTLCPPFQPWHKPHIERFFGTFARSLVELLPGFIGHNVAERSAIEARQSFADRLMTRGEVVDVRMSAAELQDFCDRWLASVYHQDAHQGLGGATPAQVAATCQDQVRTIADERVLDVLLAEAPENNGRRTVSKKGIRFDDAHFIAPELEAYIGEQVLVRFDPLDDDLGRLYVFGEDGFICIAECPQRTGMNRREVALKAKQLQTKRVQDERTALRKAARKVGTDTVVEEILTSRAEQAGKLTRLAPMPSVPHTSAGLRAAADAVAAATTPRGSSADVLKLDGVDAAWARLQAEAAADQAGVAAGNDNELARRRADEPPEFESRHARAQWLLQRQHYRALTPEEREYLATYKTDHPASYRRMSEAAAELCSTPQESDPGRSNGTGSQ